MPLSSLTIKKQESCDKIDFVDHIFFDHSFSDLKKINNQNFFSKIFEKFLLNIILKKNLKANGTVTILIQYYIYYIKKISR